MNNQLPAIKSILAGVTKADIRRDPFPHILIENPLDADLYQALASGMPTAEYISARHGKAMMSNERYNYMSQHMMDDPNMSQTWKDFAAYHSSAAFLKEVLDLFYDDIIACNPNAEELCGPLRELRVGRRNRDNFDQHDILMDCSAVINSPVTGKPSSYRGPHIDKPFKLFGGLFYMRLPEDDSTGGDLLLYKYRKGDHKFHTAESEYRGNRFDIDPKYVEEVGKVEYRSNVLIMYPINQLALHGVSVRSVTPHQRRFTALVGDLQHSLFDLNV